MSLRLLVLGVTAVACVAAGATAQTVGGEPPPGHWAPLPQTAAAPLTVSIAGQMQGQYASVRRQMTALVDRMPAEYYGFAPTPAMRPFVQSVAHVIASNFSYCTNLTGQPNPHKGEDLEKTITTKDAAVPLLKESFEYCGAFAANPTTETITTTYQANSVGADGQKSQVAVERGGLFANFLEHNNEMYGYLSVYLRLKGLVPPSSDPRPGRGGQ